MALTSLRFFPLIISRVCDIASEIISVLWFIPFTSLVILDLTVALGSVRFNTSFYVSGFFFLISPTIPLPLPWFFLLCSQKYVQWPTAVILFSPKNDSADACLPLSSQTVRWLWATLQFFLQGRSTTEDVENRAFHCNTPNILFKILKASFWCWAAATLKSSW